MEELVYAVEDIDKILMIGRNSAYQLINKTLPDQDVYFHRIKDKKEVLDARAEEPED